MIWSWVAVKLILFFFEMSYQSLPLFFQKSNNSPENHHRRSLRTVFFFKQSSPFPSNTTNHLNHPVHYSLWRKKMPKNKELLLKTCVSLNLEGIGPARASFQHNEERKATSQICDVRRVYRVDDIGFIMPSQISTLYQNFRWCWYCC